MELLKIEYIPRDPPVLQIHGDIDMSTADVLQTALEEALATAADTVIDMAGVTFFDAAGLRVVLQAAASRNGAGPLQLINAARVERVLELVGLRDLPSIVFREAADVNGR